MRKHTNPSKHGLASRPTQLGSGVARIGVVGTALLGLAAASPMAACSCDDPVTGVTEVRPPNLSVTCPSEVASGSTASLTGEVDPAAPVYASVNGGDFAEISAGPVFGTTWQGQVELVEGTNKIDVQAQSSGGNSEVFSCTVILDDEPPATPVLDEEPPECVDGEYTFRGTTDPGATVQAGDEEVVANDDGSFSITVTVEGEETFDIVAVDEAGNESDPVSVTLVVGVEGATLDPVASPTGDDTQLLTGTKAAGTGIYIQYQGEASWNEIVPVNDATSWSYELGLNLAETSFSIRAQNAAGDPACGDPATATITKSDVCPPSIEAGDLPALTNNPELPVSGEKCAGTGIWWRYAADTLDDAEEVSALDQEETFSFTYRLMEGENVFFIHTRDGDDLWGPADGPHTVVLDTIAPNAPTFDPEPPASHDQSQLELNGSKEEGASVCLRTGQEAECTTVVNANADGTFTVTVDLVDGDNNFCFSVVDAAGNASEETCFTVERVPGPEVRILDPEDGAIIVPGELSVRAFADAENDVDSVQICLDTDCGDAPTVSVDHFARTITVPVDWENGSTHTITAEATVGGDVIANDEITVTYINDAFLVSNTSVEEHSVRPTVAVDGDGAVHVVWQDNCAQSNGCALSGDGNLPGDIFHRVFDGGSWSAISLVSHLVGDGDSTNPRIAADEDGNIHVVWQDNGSFSGSSAGSADIDILYRRWDLGTGQWDDAQVITPDSPTLDQTPDISANNGDIHVVWSRLTNDPPGDNDIFHTYFDGNTWSSALLISDGAEDGDSRAPRVAVDALGRAFIVWTDNGNYDNEPDDTSGPGGVGDTDVLLRLFSGQTLGGIELVTDNALDGDSRWPDVATDNSNVAHIVFGDFASIQGAGDDRDIFHRTYEVGTGLSLYSLVSRDDTVNSEEPSLALDQASGEMYVSWHAGSAAGSEIKYSRYVGAFVAAETVTSEGFTGLAVSSSIAFDPLNGNLHCVWQDDSPVVSSDTDQDVYYFGVSAD